MSKPTVTLIRGARGQSFHIRSDLGTPRCGVKLAQPVHQEQGIDKDVVRLGRYPVCVTCLDLTRRKPNASSSPASPQLTLI